MWKLQGTYSASFNSKSKSLICPSKHWNHTMHLMRNKCFSPPPPAAPLCCMQLCLTQAERMASPSQQLGLRVCLREPLFLTWHPSDAESDCTNGDSRSTLSFVLRCTPGSSQWKEEQESKWQLWIASWCCWAAPCSTGYTLLPTLTTM